MICPFCRCAALLALLLLVAGCASTKELAQRDEERCAARGFTPKSDDFQNCLVQLDSERDARIEARRRELLEKPYIPPSQRGQ